MLHDRARLAPIEDGEQSGLIPSRLFAQHHSGSSVLSVYHFHRRLVVPFDEVDPLITGSRAGDVDKFDVENRRPGRVIGHRTAVQIDGQQTT